MIPQAFSKTFTYGKQEVTLETGRVARQADGAVLCTIGDIKVLATVVAAKSMSPGQDFFPLSVHYIEKYYATGRIPGGYLKREGRPSEKETLTSRLIDRPIRPLFPKGFMNEVQVVLTVISADKTNDPDICAMIATSAALSISGIPFKGPIGAARVGYIDEVGYVLNPTYAELATSELDMVVAGTKDAVLMVESEADELTEDEMLGAVLFAHQEMQAVITAVNEFAADCAKPQWEWAAEAQNTALIEQVKAGYADKIKDAYKISEKMARYNALGMAREQAVAELSGQEGQPSADEVSAVFAKIEKQTVRRNVIDGEPRIDGRDTKTVRPITVEVGVLPGSHGSALFTHGETQALVACTLGTLRDGKMEDFLHGTQTDHFLFHYNFPPFSVGECGRMGATGRREIGHGRLAERGILAMMPTQDAFPYTTRIVSEITESNGSSSMASVCGSSLAMMDAGVPLKKPVAGIAMGLIKEDDGFAVLSDILGDEDHLGDMDFKVAGTRDGITALQMDIKIEGITKEIMDIALQQAYGARVHILNVMDQAIGSHRDDISDHAPRITTIKINPEKIRDVIGKGGATIRALTEETGTTIELDDNGTVKIASNNGEATKEAIRRIEEITAEVEVGRIYNGKVIRIVDFGAFVNILPGKDGLVHISQISDERVANVSDHLEMNQEVAVKVMEVDRQGRVRLSIKEAQTKEAAE